VTASSFIRREDRSVAVDSSGGTAIELESCKPCQIDMGTGEDSLQGNLTDGLTFSDVCIVGNVQLDLKLQATTPYAIGYGGNNRAIDSMYKISLKPGTNVTLKFQLVKSGTSEQYKVDETIFSTLLAQDFNTYAKGRKVDQQINRFEVDGDSISLADLPPDSSDRMVSRKYKDVSSWTATLSAKEDDGNHNFLIGGMMDIMNFTPGCVPTAKSAEESVPPSVFSCENGTYEVMQGVQAIASYENYNWMFLAENRTAYHIGRNSYNLDPYEISPSRAIFEVMQDVQAIAAGQKDSLYLAKNGTLYNQTLHQVMTGVKSMSQSWDRYIVLENGTSGIQWNCPSSTLELMTYMTEVKDAIYGHGYHGLDGFVHIAVVLLTNGTVLELELVRCQQGVKKSAKIDVPKATAIAGSHGGYYLVLTESGYVYAVGTDPGNNIQINPYTRYLGSPRLMDFPKAISIAAGKTHSLVLAQNGTVYVTGTYQLKTNDGVSVETVRTPTPITKYGPAIAPGPLILPNGGVVCSMTPFKDLRAFGDY